MKGRKRQIAVDVLGLVVKCHVSAAHCADVKVAPWVLFWVLEPYGRVSKILADKRYRGDLVTDLAVVYGVVLELSERVSTKTFEVEPLRLQTFQPSLIEVVNGRRPGSVPGGRETPIGNPFDMQRDERLRNPVCDAFEACFDATVEDGEEPVAVVQRLVQAL